MIVLGGVVEHRSLTPFFFIVSPGVKYPISTSATASYEGSDRFMLNRLS